VIKISKQEIENLKDKINKHFEETGLPAKLNYLEFITEEDEITTNMSLSPTGIVTAEVWKQINEYIEREVEKFLKEKLEKGNRLKN